MNNQCGDKRTYHAKCSQIKINKDLKIVKNMSGVMESPITYLILIILIYLFFHKK